MLPAPWDVRPDRGELVGALLARSIAVSNKWTVEYKPVTEYVRRGTNTDPDAKAPPNKPVARLQEPKGDSYSVAQ